MAREHSASRPSSLRKNRIARKFLIDYKIDAFVKSPPGRHSREGGSPEALEKTGFPPTRE